VGRGVHAKDSGVGRWLVSPAGVHLARRYVWQRRALAVVPLVLGVTSLATLGALGTGFSLWTGTGTLGQQVQLGSLDLGSSSPDMATAIANLVPGDEPQRELVLANTGNLPLSSVVLSAASSTSTALTASSSSALTITVSSCSVAWTTTTLPNGTTSYSCSGTLDNLVSEPLATLIASPAILVGTPQGVECTAALCAPNGTWDLVVTLTLPPTAPSSDQGLSSNLTLTATGYQVEGTTIL